VKPFAEINLCGMSLAVCDRHRLLDHMFAASAEGKGGWVITANLDFLRRYYKETQMRELYDRSDIKVADGMPLVWAARVQGDPVPERVPGSSLITLLAARAMQEEKSLYLLGGEPGAAQGAVRVLGERWPELKIAGYSSPMVSATPTAEQIRSIAADLNKAKPDLLLVGLGSPKQELVIDQLRREFPKVWMMGVGISFSFVAGMVDRAPPWVRRIGLEWVQRMVQEPRRLAKRYLIDDLPFAATLFWSAWRKRRQVNRRPADTPL
jgi:N-acetylglucosaminyldiphosphoundecaprenol N-acetyl-beta-D-mannosaminyltransferase